MRRTLTTPATAGVLTLPAACGATDAGDGAGIEVGDGPADANTRPTRASRTMRPMSGTTASV